MPKPTLTSDLRDKQGGGADATSASLLVGGANIPLLGFGTYGMSGPELRNILVAALHEGFRHIDTAQMYQNESDATASRRALPYTEPRANCR